MAIQKLTITLVSGEEITVVPNLADTLNFERAVKNNPHWGALSDNQLKAGPFRAWSAAKREGKITATWEEFVPLCNDVAVADEDQANALEVEGLGEPAGTTEAVTTY